MLLAFLNAGACAVRTKSCYHLVTDSRLNKFKRVAAHDTDVTLQPTKAFVQIQDLDADSLLNAMQETLDDLQVAIGWQHYTMVTVTRKPACIT
jgi:hypothetical protein